MKLTELVKEHGMISRLSRETGESRPNISHRCSKEWEVGVLNGNLVMYNPKYVTAIDAAHKAKFEAWLKENDGTFDE